MAEQHAPIGSEAVHQMWPIELLCTALENMRNISAIEPFPFHDIRLHPNHFLGRAKLYVQVQQLVIVRTFKPRIVDFTQAIARAKNQVNAVPTTAGFGEPMRKCLFCLVSRSLECIEG
jgi:hypothetical protein